MKLKWEIKKKYFHTILKQEEEFCRTGSNLCWIGKDKEQEAAFMSSNKGHSNKGGEHILSKRKRRDFTSSRRLFQATWKQQRKRQTQKTSKSSQTKLQPKGSTQEEGKQKPQWKCKHCSPSKNTHSCLSLTSATSSTSFKSICGSGWSSDSSHRG